MIPNSVDAEKLNTLVEINARINQDYFDLDAMKNTILPKIAEAEKKNGQVLWPLRVALSGEQFSPGAFEIAYILGKDETLARVKKYL